MTMNARTQLCLAVLAAMGAATATPALAAAEEVYTPPLTYYYGPAATTTYYYVEPAPRAYYYEPAPTYYYTAPTTVYVESPVIVEAPRYANEDARITQDVVDAIASDSRISGTIGVETFRNQVELTGRVTTPGQADLAVRDAKSVPGVDEVNSRLRVRVGGQF
jgi:hypothetical protein